MSDCCWFTNLIQGLLVLACLNPSLSRGRPQPELFMDEGQRHTALTVSAEPEIVFTSPPGQNWLLIPRGNLTRFDHYNLRLKWGDSEESLNLTFAENGENVLLEPPVISHINYTENSGPVKVSWLTPPDVSPQELKLRYRKLEVTNWTEITHTELELESESHDLIDLDPNSEYEVQLRFLPSETQNKMGSQWSDPVTFCTPEKASRGSLDVWRSLENGSSLLILWKPLYTCASRGKTVNYDVTYIHDGKIYVTGGTCCEMMLPSNSTEVCVSTRKKNKLGHTTCATPVCSDLPPSLEFKVWADLSGGIMVWWEEAQSPPRDPPIYLVEWKELTGAGNKEINWTRFKTANQNITLPGDFAPFVPYQVSWFVLYHNDCAGPLSFTLYSQEGVPSATTKVSIQTLSSTEALVSWEELPLQYRRGFLTNYTIYINSTDSAQRYTVSGRNLTVSGLSPRSMYSVWMTAATRAGEGPAGEIRTFQTGDSSPDILNLVYITIAVLLPFGVLLSPCTRRTLTKILWPKIPNPMSGRLDFCIPEHGNMMDIIQDSSSSPIILNDLEVVEPTPPPARPPQNNPSVYEYEKHFLPNPEEVMGLR